MGDVKGTTGISPEQLKFAEILHPYALAQHMRAVSDGIRFVHYTSAEAAIGILRSKEVWMRKSFCMNDYMEIQYGLARLYRTYRETEAGAKFQNVLNEIFGKITDDIVKLFDSWTPHFSSNTYLTCISEHMDGEDAFGRLSMWRAYGEKAGVAIVMNNSAFILPADGFGAYSSPVAYFDDHKFESEFEKITDNIRNNADFIIAQGREMVKDRIFHMLKLAVLCTKHPGFAEEKEWRVVYCPSLEESRYLAREIQVVRGVPQPVYKIPLQNIPEVGLEAAVPTLLNRIIIGPTQHQFAFAIREAFIQLLSEAGVDDAAGKVCISDIPLRC